MVKIGDIGKIGERGEYPVYIIKEGDTFTPIKRARKFKYEELNDEKWLVQMYIIEKKNSSEIADIVGCNKDTVLTALKRHHITIRRGRAEGTKVVFTEAHKEKMSIAMTGKKRKPFTEEHKRKMREARRHRKFPEHHTKPESIFEAICKKYHLPYKYTGDGSFWIKNINPDFVDVNGKKIAIEIAGDWWHNSLTHLKLPYKNTMEYRKKTLKKYGWKLGILFEHDLLRTNAEHFVLAELKRVIK